MSAAETTVYRAPLVLQFLDSVGNRPVGDGLVVTAWPRDDPAAYRYGWRSPLEATIGFGRLSGTYSFEETVTPDPTQLLWSPPSAGHPYEVRVTDQARRYLPELISVSVPQPGLLIWPLFSAPTRPAPSGWAAITGEVWRTTTRQPAAWSLVDVAAGSATYRTLADGSGRFVVFFPYPEALPPLTGSPAAGEPLNQISWPLSVSVRYQPSTHVRLADASTDDPPELTSLIGQLPAAISTSGGTSASLAATLTFGGRLLLMIDVIPA
jgi:hypothetical protein